MDLSLPLGAECVPCRLSVNVRTVGSRSMPPLAVPPESFNWKVIVAYFACELKSVAPGVNTRLLPDFGTNCPGEIVAPLSDREPFPATALIFTDSKALDGA